MLTNKFYSMLRPFFNSRGSSELSNNDMLDNYTNLVIQDIYNRHGWFFKNIYEDITVSTPSGDGFKKWTTTYNIDSTINIYDQDNNLLTPSFRKIGKDVGDDNFMEIDCNVGENFIITKDTVEWVYIEYIKGHKWFTYEEMKSLELPIPNKFIPPLLLLIYDLASPLSYFEDDNTTPRYEIAEKQLTYIKNNDGISESVYLAPSKGL